MWPAHRTPTVSISESQGRIQWPAWWALSLSMAAIKTLADISTPQSEWFDFMFQEELEHCWQVQPCEAPSLSSATSHSMMSSPPPTISNLPVELLQMIFSYCAEPQPDDSAFQLCRAYPHWIAITYVCRHWRAAALNHHSLWTSINTDHLGTRWAISFMKRSNPALVDLTVRIDPIIYGTRHKNAHEILVILLFGCKRLRTLHVVGETGSVYKVLSVLDTATPIRSLSLDIVDGGGFPVFLPHHLFGRQAPIHEVCFAARGYIVAPHGLFHGVTHFISSQQIPLQDLLDSLRQMPALQSFTLQHCNLIWEDTDAPWNVQIPMRNLTCLTVDVNSRSPFFFALLNQRLALPDGAKRKLHLHTATDWDESNSALWTPSVLAAIRAANGLRHIRLSGGIREGSFCLWTGDSNVEEAEFSFEVTWWFRKLGSVPSPIFDLARLCDLLDAKTARKLALLINPLGCIELGRLYWWTLLESMTAVEELEVRVEAIRELRYAWAVYSAPAVLPKLRRVRITQAISKASSVEETTEEGLMRLLQGSAT